MAADGGLPAGASPSPAPQGSATRWTAHAAAWAAILFVVAVALGTTAGQGGYFSTSWGWTTVALVLAIEIWLVFSGRTDAGRADLFFLGALALFVAWVALSTIWSTNPDQTIQEIERVLVLVAGVAAFVILVRRTLVARITTVLVGGMTLVAAYGLATRLLPERPRRLRSRRRATDCPSLSATGTGSASSAPWERFLPSEWRPMTERPSLRAPIAGVALIVLPVTLYFTFSRGGIGGLAAGALAVALVSDRRLRLAATAAAVLPIPALAVFLSSRSEALTHRLSEASDVSDEGRRLALTLGVLVLVEIAVVIVLGVVAKRVVLSPHARRVTGASCCSSSPRPFSLDSCARATPSPGSRAPTGRSRPLPRRKTRSI